jgi:iron complex outermembrane receptor protein
VHNKTNFMRKLAILFTLCVMVGLGALAQSNGKISGIINDEGGKALGSATVSLLRARDSGLVKLAVTNKEGLYEFINMKDGKYLVSVTSVGYGKKISPAFDLAGNDVTMAAIALMQKTKDLGAVTVSTTKPFRFFN